jgi:hypothetical protein
MVLRSRRWVCIPARIACVAALLALPLVSAFAGTPDRDQVLLKNGDRVSGQFIGMTDDSLSMDTVAMGRVTIHRDLVRHLIVGGEEKVLRASQPQPAAPATEPIWGFQFSGTPEAVTLGTENQEQFGGGITWSYLSGTRRNETTFTAQGTHVRIYEAKSPSINLDTADARIEELRRFHSASGSAIVGAAEFFNNNSLGMAMQKSASVGVRSPNWAYKELEYWGAAHIVFLNEHLDHTAAVDNLAGLRFEVQSSVNSTRVFSLHESAWIMPTLNNVHGLQAYADLSPAWVVKKNWLKLQLDESEWYLGNAPKPNRKNYINNSLSLTVQLTNHKATQ